MTPLLLIQTAELVAGGAILAMLALLVGIVLVVGWLLATLVLVVVKR